MTEQNFLITVEVQGRLLTDILTVLTDRRVRLVNVVPAAPITSTSTSTSPSPSRKKLSHYVNGVRFKGILGRDLLKDTLVERSPRSTQELEHIFAQHGFASNSVSPALSKAIRFGVAQRNADGTYSLASSPQQVMALPHSGR